MTIENAGVHIETKTGKCRRCNRTLKNPVAVEKGIGPVCERKEMAVGAAFAHANRQTTETA